MIVIIYVYWPLVTIEEFLRCTFQFQEKEELLLLCRHRHPLSSVREKGSPSLRRLTHFLLIVLAPIPPTWRECDPSSQQMVCLSSRELPEE